MLVFREVVLFFLFTFLESQGMEDSGCDSVSGLPKEYMTWHDSFLMYFASSKQFFFLPKAIELVVYEEINIIQLEKGLCQFPEYF